MNKAGLSVSSSSRSNELLCVVSNQKAPVNAFDQLLGFPGRTVEVVAVEQQSSLEADFRNLILFRIGPTHRPDDRTTDLSLKQAFQIYYKAILPSVSLFPEATKTKSGLKKKSFAKPAVV